MSFIKFISFFPLLLSLLPNNQQIISFSTQFLLTFFLLTFFPLTFNPSTIQTYPKSIHNGDLHFGVVKRVPCEHINLL